MGNMVINPIQFFADRSGLPLDDGNVFIGAPNTNPMTNPVSVYQDVAMTIPMQQPLKTTQGAFSLNGTPLPVYIGASAYSMAVLDRGGNVVMSLTNVANSIFSQVNRVVSSIAQLRTLPSLLFSNAFVTGYYAAHDGGGGAYQLDPNDTTSADNGGTIIVASDGGRWKLQVIGRLTARQFGVKADGTTDDTQSLLNAIAVISPNGGYLDCSDCNKIKISQTIKIGNGTAGAASTINNVFLIGAGGSGPFSNDFGTTLLWAGSAAPVIEFLGAMTGGGMLGGWTLDGGGVATQGLIVNHVEGAQFPRLKIKGCTGVYLSLTAQTNPDTIGGCRNNRFGTYTTDTIPGGATGLLLDGPTTLTSILQNTFDVVDIPISGTGAIGIQLGYCDFNVFGTVDISRQTTQTNSIGLKLVGSGPSGNQIFPSMNKFQCLAAGGGITTDSTNGRPYGNTIDIYDLADSDGGVPTAAGVLGYAPNILPATGLGVRVIRFGYINPGWTTSTPAIPAGTGSGDKVTNINTYTVRIYQETSVGNPSGQHIIDGQGTDNAITAITPIFDLGPGESVYYTGTLPVSWAWFGLAD